MLILVLTLLLAAPAHAGWFPAAPIDGPDVVAVGNVDLARDGAGAVVYVRNDGGVPHAFMSRIAGGVWGRPARLDPTGEPVTEVKVAVGDALRVATVWVAGGNVWASVSGGSPVQVGGPDARSVDIDMGVNDAAYAVWEQAGDVRAARLQDATWTALAPPLDVDPALEAGTGALRPKVAVSAEGFAVATWGDRPASAPTRVWARRLTGMNLSVAPQLLTLPNQGASDSPDIDIEDDGSWAWVVFRQDLDGVSRTLGRRLVGSLFEAPEPIDAGASSNEPRIDMNDRGVGFAVAQLYGGQVVGSWLDHDHFQRAARLDGGDSAAPTKPEVASVDHADIAVAWRSNNVARARFKDAGAALGPEYVVSRPDLGPVADPGVFISGDRVGDFAVAMAQGDPGARTLAVAHFDRPPSAPFVVATRGYERTTEVDLRWTPGVELWGDQRFRVLVDGAVIAETAAARARVTLVPGRHTFQVEAVDSAGQTSRSRARTLRVDPLPPTLRVRVTGARKAGRLVKVTVRAADVGVAGLHHVTVDYGDRSPTTRTAVTRHRYKRGTYMLNVAAVDKAGNVTRKRMKLRIRQ